MIEIRELAARTQNHDDPQYRAVQEVFANFYHRFIKLYSKIANALPALTMFARYLRRSTLRYMSLIQKYLKEQFQITLQDDNPQAVEGILRLIYGLPLAGQPEENYVKRLLFILSLYTAADKYLVPTVKDIAVAKFRKPSFSAAIGWTTMSTTKDRCVVPSAGLTPHITL